MIQNTVLFTPEIVARRPKWTGSFPGGKAEIEELNLRPDKPLLLRENARQLYRLGDG